MTVLKTSQGLRGYDEPDRCLLEDTKERTLLMIHFPDDLPVFADHFEGAPLVPGVVQLKWAFDQASARIDVNRACTLQVLKFTRPIRPGRKIMLEIVYTRRDGFSFRYFDDRLEYSSGVVSFVAE